MRDVLPDCVLPISQKTGVGVLSRSSWSVASRSGGRSLPPRNIRFIVPHSWLMFGSIPDRTRSAEWLAPVGVAPFPEAGLSGTIILAGSPQIVRTGHAMDGALSNLKLFSGDPSISASGARSDPVTPLPQPVVSVPLPDPNVLANRELIRPVAYRRAVHGIAPFSAAWYDELEQKRYQRHGAWLAGALEFGRHPGESLLLLGPGVGSDAVRYMINGTPVTIGSTDLDHPDIVSENLTRRSLPWRIVDVSAPGASVCRRHLRRGHVECSLRPDSAPCGSHRRTLSRVEVGREIDRVIPRTLRRRLLAGLDPSTSAALLASSRGPDERYENHRAELRCAFATFAKVSIGKRHLRARNCPTCGAMLPLVLLERLIGRVLVFKAFKPLSAAHRHFHSARGVTSPNAILIA